MSVNHIREVSARLILQEIMFFFSSWVVYKTRSLKSMAGYLTVLGFYTNTVLSVRYWTDCKSKNLKSMTECWTLLRFYNKRCDIDLVDRSSTAQQRDIDPCIFIRHGFRLRRSPRCPIKSDSYKRDAGGKDETDDKHLEDARGKKNRDDILMWPIKKLRSIRPSSVPLFLDHTA